MSSGPTFYGDVPTSKIAFVMQNILARGKWIAADSTTPDKLLSNLQLVQDAGQFAFFTHPDTATTMEQIAQQYMYRGQRFKFHIEATIYVLTKQGQYTGTQLKVDLNLSGCELLFATGYPPTFGVRFEDSNLHHRVESYSSGGHSNYYRRSYGRYGYDRYGRPNNSRYDPYGNWRRGHGRHGYGGHGRY